MNKYKIKAKQNKILQDVMKKNSIKKIIKNSNKKDDKIKRKLQFKKTSYKLMLNIIFGTLIICGNFTQIKQSEDVYHKMNIISFSLFVILILMVSILEQKQQPTRYLKMVYIGLLFLRMYITFANHVKISKYM